MFPAKTQKVSNPHDISWTSPPDSFTSKRMPALVKFAIFTLLCQLALPVGHASVAMPGDGSYYRVRRERTLYIYDESARDSVEQIAAYLAAIRAGYDTSFAWQLDEPQDLILLSPKQQVANAYATISPNVKSVWYPSGSAMLENMAESSWALALATHETSHLYQLNAKGPVPAAIKKVTGNAFTIFPFVLPIFIHPNILTPTFMIEGNAVFNESRANLGGRLHSGEARALVLAQIKAGDINPSRLINNQLRFPYGENPYLQGGYFQAHLAAKYGVEKTNQFFLAQGDHWLWPLVLNKTFRDHFGSSYPQEVHEYVREMEALAKNQSVQSSPLMSGAEFVSPFNHDKDRIFYIASDGRRMQRLEVYDKRTHRLSFERRDLPLGKVFWMDGEPVTSASDMHDLHHVEYSLYGEGYRFDPRYRGQIVNDMRAGKTVALAATNSWLEPRVLVDGEAYDVGHSQPILDDEGSVYYFRQNGSEKLLYKNRQLMAKFDGFYAKATEVAPDGTFYFIGNTDYGSTLYQLKNREFSRVLASDRVVDARLVGDGEFLINEVSATGHEIKLAMSEVKPGVPAVYSYGFPSYSIMPGKVKDAEQAKSDESTYNSWRQMRYSAMDIAMFWDGAFGLGLSLAANFVDPLQYQDVLLAYSGNERRAEDVLVGYTFTKYLPQFFTTYMFSREKQKQGDGYRRWSYRQWGQAGVLLPLLRWRHWDASLSVAATYHKRDHYDDTASAPVRTLRINEETYGADSGVSIHYQKDPSPAAGMFPWQAFDLNYKNRLDTLPRRGMTKDSNASIVQTQYRQGFPLQFYGLLAGTVAWSEQNDIHLGFNQYALDDSVRIPRIAPHEFFDVRKASSARFEVNKVFDIHGYTTRIPIGLDRLAPLAVAQGIFLDNHGRGQGEYPANIFEWGVGADFQVLILHLVHAKLRYLAGFDTRHPITSKKDELTFTLHHEF